jgi:hypothetical protein
MFLSIILILYHQILFKIDFIPTSTNRSQKSFALIWSWLSSYYVPCMRLTICCPRLECQTLRFQLSPQNFLHFYVHRRHVATWYLTIYHSPHTVSHPPCTSHTPFLILHAHRTHLFFLIFHSFSPKRTCQILNITGGNPQIEKHGPDLSSAW